MCDIQNMGMQSTLRGVKYSGTVGHAYNLIYMRDGYGENHSSSQDRQKT
jgi:hypothetical protein